MNIDYKKTDKISKMENKLEKLLPKITKNREILVNNKYVNKDFEEQTIYILTIITILYKEKNYMIYTMEKSKKIDQELTQDLLTNINAINYIINEIKEEIKKKHILESLLIIDSYSDIIEVTLELYFERKTTNYILEKMPLEIIEKQKKLKTLLQVNPFAINQFLQYSKEPLTTEEKIINEVIELNRIATLMLDEELEKITLLEFEKKKMKLVKKQILKNHKNIELSNIILFMVSNTYQEIMENPEDITYNEIKAIIENNKVENNELVKFFIENDNFSSIIIGKFLEYNINIKKGRLEALKEKATYQYVVKRYKK